MENLRTIYQTVKDRTGTLFGRQRVNPYMTSALANSTGAARFVGENIDALAPITEFQPYMRRELGGLMAHIIHEIVAPVDTKRLVDNFNYGFVSRLSHFDAYSATLPEHVNLDALDPRHRVIDTFGATIEDELKARHEVVFTSLQRGLGEGEEPNDFLKKVFARYKQIFPLYQAHLQQFGATTNGSYDRVISNALGGEILACEWLYKSIPRLYELHGHSIASTEKPKEFGEIYKNSYPSVSAFTRVPLNTNGGMEGFFRFGIPDEDLMRFFEIVDFGGGKKLVLKVPAAEVQAYALEKANLPAFPTDVPDIECPAMAVIGKGNAVKKIYDTFATNAEMLYDFENGVTYKRRTREQALAIKPFFIPDY